MESLIAKDPTLRKEQRRMLIVQVRNCPQEFLTGVDQRTWYGTDQLRFMRCQYCGKAAALEAEQLSFRLPGNVGMNVEFACRTCYDQVRTDCKVAAPRLVDRGRYLTLKFWRQFSIQRELNPLPDFPPELVSVADRITQAGRY